MPSFISTESPVIIGGGGGSGTRVIAEILKAHGYYIGSDLNEASDNLWFTLIFKRPAWLKKEISLTSSHRLNQGMMIFEKAMLGGGKYSLDDKLFLAKAACSISLTGHDHLRSGHGKWPFYRAASILKRAHITNNNIQPWGWKEPNSHIYIEQLGKYFPNAKYIHVMRNGLDMAFSNNQAQLYNWSWLYGIDIP